MLNRTQLNFFYVLMGAAALFTLAIFFPYFSPLFMAGIMAIVFTPFYQKMYRTLWEKENLAAFVTVIVVFLIILVPLGLLAFFIVQEIRGVYSYLTDEGGILVVTDFLGRMQIFLDRFLPDSWVPETSLPVLQGHLESVYVWFRLHFQSILNNTLTLVGYIFVFVLAFFFFLRDGTKFKAIISKLSPLDDAHDTNIINKINFSVNSIVKGTLLVAIAQGFLATIGFLVTDLPSPILWGTVTIFAALIPSLGTVIIILPASIFLVFSSGLWWGVGLLIWGVLVVGLIDNLLRPLILERDINIHPFLILLSVFGGITVFGFSGILLGPIALSILFALTEVYNEVTPSAPSPQPHAISPKDDSHSA